MKGFGIIKGLGVTLKHIYDTYAEDIKAGRKRYYNEGWCPAAHDP